MPRISELHEALYQLGGFCARHGLEEKPKLRIVFASEQDRYLFEKAIALNLHPNDARNPNLQPHLNRFELVGTKFALLTEDR